MLITIKEQCLKTHIELIEKLKSLENKYPLYDVIKSILENGYYIKDQIDLDTLLFIIKQNIEYLGQTQSYDNHRLFLDLKEKYYDFIEDKSRKEEVEIKKI